MTSKDDYDDILADLDGTSSDGTLSGDTIEFDDEFVAAPKEDVHQAWYRLLESDSETVEPPTYSHTFDEHSDEILDRLDERDDVDYDTYEITIDPDMTNEVIERIADEIHKRESQGYDISQLVLGQPQYEVVMAFAQERYGGNPEDALPIYEIIVVPGPQIHPVIDNRRMLIEYQSQKDE